ISDVFSSDLVKHAPEIGIITNIELDHPDHYDTLEEVIDIFQTFAKGCKTLIGSIDCVTVRDRLQPTISYSLHSDTDADYTVTNIDYRADGTTALVW
ncbi:MAG: Mur ligase family protein, partial [Nostoc sp.]